MKRFYAGFLAVGVVMLVLTGCGRGRSQRGGDDNTLRIIGSNTVTPISTAWAEGFMKKNPKVNVSVSGPGSGPGIAAVIDNNTDIGQASRKIREAEISRAKENGVDVVETIIAWDGLAVLVNRKNPVNELTMEQLKNIYLGRITNWSEVGGNDQEIVVVSRDTASGTHVFFREVVLEKGEFTQKALFLPSTSTGVNEVSNNAAAVFYAGLGYVTKDVKVVGIKANEGASAVRPSIKTVNDKSYTLARPLFYYTNGAPKGLAKSFIEYGMTAEGKALVEKLGFVPLP